MDKQRFLEEIRPKRKQKRVLLAVVVSCVGFSVALSGPLTPAFGCSIAAPNPDTRFVRFVGKATKHETRVVSDISATSDWTFVVKSWSRSSDGKRHKIGSKITINVIESPTIPTTTSSPNGTYNSCAGIQFGVTTEFRRNGIYDVTAAIHKSSYGGTDDYLVSHFVGLLLPRT